LRPAGYHAAMDRNNNIEQSWWHSSKRVLAMIAGLVGLVGFSLAFIYFVAKIFDQGGRKQQLPVFIDATTPPPPAQNPRTRAAPSTSWPDHPGRGAAVSFTGGRNESSRTRGGDGPVSNPNTSTTEKPAVPVGISEEEYRAAVDSGKKVYLPNPQGECDLSGQSASKSINALDSCFAKQAAR